MLKSSPQLKLSAAACALAMAVFALNAPAISHGSKSATATISPSAGIEAPSTFAGFAALLPR
ncbi:hypothetical protein ACWPM1_05875 [Tsuneonella sp. HG249]